MSGDLNNTDPMTKRMLNSLRVTLSDAVNLDQLEPVELTTEEALRLAIEMAEGDEGTSLTDLRDGIRP